jgi:hypothetical protein
MRGVKTSIHTNGSDNKILPPRIFNRRFLRVVWNEDTGTYYEQRRKRHATDQHLTRRILDEDFRSIHFLSSKPVKNNYFVHHEVL